MNQDPLETKRQPKRTPEASPPPCLPQLAAAPKDPVTQETQPGARQELLSAIPAFWGHSTWGTGLRTGKIVHQQLLQVFDLSLNLGHVRRVRRGGK